MIYMKEKLSEKDREKVLEFHNLVVKGLNNGFTHTIDDGRREDIEWVRGRLELWESFGRTLFGFLSGLNDYSYSLKDLQEIANVGYKKEKKKNDRRKTIE